MKFKKHSFLFGINLFLCGNVFAVSPYATTIQQNIPKKSFLIATSFPKTIADVPFADRIKNKTAGYRPYFNRSAFAGLTIEEQDELESMAYQSELYRRSFFDSHTIEEYCEEYPESPECPNTHTSETSSPSNTNIAQSAEYIYPINPPTTISIPPTTTVNTAPIPYMRVALTPENIAKYGLKTHNGGCTPPERSNHWRNQILTSGRYQSIAPAFEKFLITSFRKEGSCGNHPNDRGGYTCYGCASNGLCKGIDMNKVTRPLVEDLYYEKVYTKYNVNKLPDAFRGYLLWGMSGSGPVTGIKQFQGALGVPLTGKIDDATIHAAENYTGDFADAYTKNCEQFLRNIVARDPSQKVFLKGWLNGLALLRPCGCHVIPTTPIYR